jgi:hypothetical protein
MGYGGLNGSSIPVHGRVLEIVTALPVVDPIPMNGTDTL